MDGPVGDNQVQSDFVASRAIAQRGNPEADLDALLVPKPPAAPIAPEGGAAAPEAPPTPSGVGLAQRLVSAASATASDVAGGIADAPRQVLGGVLDFGNNLMRFADTIVKHADAEGVPNVYFRLFDKGGNWSPAAMSPEQFRAEQAAGRDDVFQVPTTGGPDTVTGNLVRTATTFIAGRGRLAGAAGGGLVGNGVADFASGAVGSDPNQARLSNVLDSVAPNFLTDWLKAKPDQEGGMLDRLKSGLEYAGLGAAFGGIVKALGFARDAMTGASEKAAPAAGLGAAPDGTAAGDAGEGAASGEGEAAAPAQADAGLGASGGQPGAGGVSSAGQTPTFLDHSWIRAQATDASGAYDMGAGAKAMADQVDAALQRGDAVTLVTDGGAKRVPIVAVDNGMMADAAGQRWGTMSIAADGTGKEGVEIAASGAGPDAPGGASPSATTAQSADDFLKGIPQSDLGPSTLGQVSDQAPRPGIDITGSGGVNTGTIRPDGSPPATPLRPILPLGDAEKPLVEVTPAVADQADDFIHYLPGKNPVNLNLARIGSGDDIRNALEEVSKFIPSQGVQSNQSTQMLADTLGMSAEDLLRGYKGAQLDASESVAARMVLDSSAEQLVNFSKAATDPATASPEAQATFVRAFATHRAIQQYVENARSEAGRTLQSWSMMSQTRSDLSRTIEALMQQAGGRESVEDIAGKIADLDDPTKVGRFVADAARGNSPFLQVFYNVLLSNPQTVVKKLASDMGMALWNLAARQTAEWMGSDAMPAAMRNSGSVPPGEAGALAAGYIGALRDGLRMAGRALIRGGSQFHSEASTIEALQPRLATLADGAPAALDPAQPTAAALSYWRAALPTSWIGAADDFAKFVNYRAELRALAFRDAVSQGMDNAGIATHVTQTMDAPPMEMHQQAWSAALKNTFQEPLEGFAKNLQTLVDSATPTVHGVDLPLGRILMPFVKTPANIAAWGFRNSALSLPFENSAVRTAMAAGGATRDLAVARVSLGSALALTMADLALTRTVTGQGPSDPQLQRAWRAGGNEPYSIRVGDNWYGYNKVEPVGLMMGAIADSFDVARFAKDDGRTAVAESVILGAGNAMLSKTYMSGLARFFDALHNPDQDGAAWGQSLVDSLVTPPGLAVVAQATDPWVRAHYDLLDSLWRRVPYLSQDLPPARTLWGDPIPAKQGFAPFLTGTTGANIMSPVSTSPVQSEPIDKWIWDNRQAFARSDENKLGLTKPGIFQNFSGGPGVSAQVELTPAQHDRLQVLAGNDLKDPVSGLGAKETLNALLAGDHPSQGMQQQWDAASPAMKAMMVQKVVNGFREGARKQLLTEAPDIRDAVQAQMGARRDQLQPAMPSIDGSP